MGTVPVPSSEAANLGILSELMGREVVEKLWFERFTSEDIREGLSSMEQRPAVAPIKRYTEFQTKGMDHMLITVDKPYTEAEFHGDAIVTGHGEKDKWDYSRLYINQIQKPIEGPGRMGNQRIKVLDIIARERPKITTYMARKREEHTVSAMYEGFSKGITASVANSGLAKTKRYHPNFYVAGQGLVTWSGTVQTHANNIGGALQGLTNTASDHFTVSNLEELMAAVEAIPLEPVELGNGKVAYILLAHYNQVKQLRQDPQWREEASRAYLRGLDNPLWAAAELHVANFLVFKRNFSVWGVQETDTGSGVFTLQFGASNPLSALDSYNKKVAYVLGNNAINEGVASDIIIDEQAQNINNYKEIVARQIIGYARNDFYDVDIDSSTPTTGKNQSSALFATYSPDPFA